VELKLTEKEEYTMKGCKFAGRCPYVMDVCKTTEPPDVSLNGRSVKCFLYKD